ncbi:S-adenosylmethionine sensor upstream of mTORC1 [Lepeophtheirus salmonis]|uniref:S-adenosylmethionine sensor upstream of mTORC1 n=1 Tax=Lepeophtheirus salmonis TaxID=72036 RepID=UPI001AE3E487|nr:S-adenosylmethionine sensor upstream of mTORC1-like [Lepeophtheirus salmonis]
MASGSQIHRRNELATKIKSFHGELRKKSRVAEEADQVWSHHVQSRKVSDDSYSAWMKELGSHHWDQKERRNWIQKKTQEYFHEGGREKLIEKLSRNNPDISVHVEPLEDRIQVLDVGSCYNPFKDIDPKWDVLAIDLKSSETDNVYECDFLSVSLSPFLGLNEKVIEYLPQNYFDFLIFSLFLEYLPLPSLRLKAILKAHEVLKPLGLLIILTPDSSHVGKNVKQMKAWRACLAHKGFVRVYYEKKTHIHCIAYAKVNKEDEMLKKQSSKLLKEIDMENMKEEELLYISPDKSTAKEIKELENYTCDTELNDQIYSFEDLPYLEV